MFEKNHDCFEIDKSFPFLIFHFCSLFFSFFSSYVLIVPFFSLFYFSSEGYNARAKWYAIYTADDSLPFVYFRHPSDTSEQFILCSCLDTFMSKFVFGGLSGAISKTACAPFSRLTVLLETSVTLPGTSYSGQIVSKQRKIIGTMKNIYKKEGTFRVSFAIDRCLVPRSERILQRQLRRHPKGVSVLCDLLLLLRAHFLQD